MKNTLKQLIHTNEIDRQKADAKKFYRFVAIFQNKVSDTQIIINSNLTLKLLNQSSEQIQTLQPKDNVLVMAQIVEQGKSIEGQIQKISIEDALKYDNLMRKIKYKAYEKSNKISQMKVLDQQENIKGSLVIGNKNSAFNQHF